jgi:hypothetical protein
MIGNLFYQGVAPSEIKAMTWLEMVYWNRWAKLLNKEKAIALEKLMG